MDNNPEIKDRKFGLKPEALDIIKIDGRWGQVLAIGGDVPTTIRFLSDGKIDSRNLTDYEITKYFGSSLENFLEKEHAGITEQEKGNLHYDPLHKNDPEYTKMINFFGEYKKK